MKLELDFYKRESLVVAQDLLGKALVVKDKRGELRAKIVEVEAYAGEEDRACHTFGGKRTPRTEIMYGRAGKLYVYMIYGMYYLSNVITGPIGRGQGVLLRGIEPLGNWEAFSQNRYGKEYKSLNAYQRKNLCNGPGKLSKALGINKEDYGVDLLGDYIFIEEGEEKAIEYVVDKRIGIDYAQEAKDYLYRFYIEGNPYVSVFKKES